MTRTLALALLFAISVACLPSVADEDCGIDYDGGFVIHHCHPPYIPGYTQPERPPTDTGSLRPSDDYYPDFGIFYRLTPSHQPAPSPYAGLYGYLPWNQDGFDGYTEPDSTASASGYARAEKYRLADQVVRGSTDTPIGRAVFASHLPSPSGLWFDEQWKGNGGDRFMTTPPLKQGSSYYYEISAAWMEDGHWVAQRRTVNFSAGQVHALYLAPADSGANKK